jgi:hypothetical protein
MTTLIAQELESEELHRFHADFRRALLMHRKESLNLFFRLQFPMAESPFYEGDWSVEHLGIVRWLAEPPSESIREHAIYRELIARQESLIRLARKVVDGIEKGVPQAGSYANLLHAMHEFDRVADRLSAGITQSVSIGAVEAAGNEPIPAVIKRADAALYRAKQSGRNRVEMDDPRIT